jgi:peptide/nickel transport system permease protein
MTQYLIRRLFTLLPVFILMTVITFALIRLIPGDPIDVMYGSEGMDEARRAALASELGLDQPVVVQYVKWLGRTLTGDLGRSYRANMPVSQLILNRLPATLFLSLAALLFSIMIAFPLGILAAVKRNTWADMGALGFAVLGISLPQFWSGILLVLVFSVWLGWLPSIGYVSPTQDFIRFISHLILPAITLGWGLAGATTRLVRNSLLDEMDAEYVRTARSKGLHERVVLWGHALRNALIPAVTMVGLQFAFLIGGAVVVEVIFVLPGIGLLIVDSIFSRDYPVVQGVIMTIAVLVVVINLAIDVLYTLIDPRIRLS